MEAARAPVRPRVLTEDAAEPVLLEDVIAEELAVAPEGVIALVGDAGSGKTTALAHLAAALKPGSRTGLLDEPDADGVAHAAAFGPVVYAARRPLPRAQRVLRLARWTDDDAIEYGVTRHGSAGADALRRWLAWDRRFEVDGLARVVAALLDALVADPGLTDPPKAVVRLLHAAAPTPAQRLRTGRYCYEASVSVSSSQAGRVPLLLAETPSSARWLLANRGVRRVAAAEHLAAMLRAELRAPLGRTLSGGLLEICAGVVRRDAAALAFLRRTVARGGRSTFPTAASLLHACGEAFLPPAAERVRIEWALLDGVRWERCGLRRALGRHVSLRRATLRGADLSAAVLQEANLDGADLREALLEGAEMVRASLVGATLAGARADAANWNEATLDGACLDGAHARRADLSGASLRDASLRDADLGAAILADTQVAGADLSGAYLGFATLLRVALAQARLHRARFELATVVSCDLSGASLAGVSFARAKLHDADLGGALLEGADFSNAQLRACGLADVDMENADLRRADLRGSTFHMGSSRSGLVLSPIASEGTRTGFYTDDYAGLETHRAPEEIRKANLCGADLRDATVEGVDFYLVDLRRARYDTEQAEWFRKCGAILYARA